MQAPHQGPTRGQGKNEWIFLQRAGEKAPQPRDQPTRPPGNEARAAEMRKQVTEYS